MGIRVFERGFDQIDYLWKIADAPNLKKFILVKLKMGSVCRGAEFGLHK